MQWYYWIILIVVLTIIEINTVNLVTIWFVISAIVSLILSVFIDNTFILLIVFVLLGTLLLIITKPFVKRHINVNKEATNTDRVIGMKGICTEDINKNSIGEVKVDGKRWSAISKDNILKDDVCIVTDIEGVKLKVKKEDEE